MSKLRFSIAVSLDGYAAGPSRARRTRSGSTAPVKRAAVR